MQNELPRAVYFRVALAGAAFPVEVVPFPVPPQSVHIDDGERAIALLGNDDLESG